jgi:diguanylate cyclase (GGDEF)-like protein
LLTSIVDNPGLAHWLVMADLDGLKQINDSYGHQMGDLALRTVAAAMERPGAIVGRYGGDEFVALIVGYSRSGAASYAEAVQQTLARMPLADFRTKAKVVPQVTFGIAGYPQDAASPTALIRAADEAMFQQRVWSPRRAGLAI